MIRHRGPDQFGIYLDDHVGLGNARLSIVDLGGGQQPITNEDRRFWIVYNGEIFNHAELREELLARGHRFETHYDTEVFLHYYEQEGPACLRRFNGQFGVAIWDSLKRELFLARDRVGVRPIYYTFREGAFIFGSEIKALSAHPAVALELDPLALDQTFTGWSCLPPRSPFAGVQQLPPGHCALVSAERSVQVHAWWRPDFSTPPATPTLQPSNPPALRQTPPASTNSVTSSPMPRACACSRTCRSAPTLLEGSRGHRRRAAQRLLLHRRPWPRG